ncbi:MAG: glycosyltransferase [Chitinophagaceae bacterium]
MAKFLFYDDQIINILLKEERPSGGAAVQAYGWIRGLEELGHDVHIMTRKPATGELKKENAGLNIVGTYDNDKGIRWLRWVYYRIPFIYRKIRDTKPDYLYQGVPGWTSFLFGRICRLLDIKFLVRISNDIIVDDRITKKFSKTYLYLQQHGLKLAYCIMCQNDYQYEQVKKRFPSKLVLKISNPVYQKFEGARPLAGPTSYIAWIGIFQYQKNLKLLYEIAKALPHQNFRIAGKEDPKCDQDTHLYIARLKELPNVRFVGFLNRLEVLSFVAQASYLLNTSHYEGFSNTFLEAMSAGTPIISGKNVNPDHIITRYSLGIIYNDVNDLVEKLGEVTPEGYEDMTIGASNYLAQHHDYLILSARLNRFLEKGAGEGRTDKLSAQTPVTATSRLVNH